MKPTHPPRSARQGIAVLALLPLVCIPAVLHAADEATPAVTATTAAAAGKSGLYSADKTDFDGRGRQIRDVVKEIADLFGFNVNIPDDLQGPVNDKLINARWQDFFSMILEKKGYGWRIDGDIVVIEKKKADLKNKIRKLDSGNISVEFDKVPVADAVAAICDVMEKNLAPLPAELLADASAAPGSPAAGTGAKVVTINWKGVSWQRTLAQILARFNYGFREEEGVIQVMPLADLNNVASETRVYKVNFADAKAVSDTINSVFKTVATPSATPGAAAATGPVLTASYESTQQLVIVTAKPDFLRSEEGHILSLITQIDQPARQVVIESKIVERSADNGFQLGFKYAYGPGNTTGNVNASTAATRNVSSSAATLGSFASQTGGTGTGPASFILSEHDFKFFMDAVETDSTANILQNPTVIVKDDGQGAIRIVRRTPYFEQNTTAGTTTTIAYTIKFINIGTSLYVKPKIKGNDHIQLTIDQAAGGGALSGGGAAENQEGSGGLTVSAKFTDIENPGGGTVPVVDNRDVRTSVLLRDGYTVALGGLVKDTDARNVTQTPILGDIPVLGRLFQSNSTTKTKLNLMAFITARIIDPFNSNYRDILGLDRVNELGLASREIEGGSYKISEAERDALSELMHKRDLEANAAKSAQNNRRLNGESN